jgi:hypothetical protein
MSCYTLHGGRACSLLRPAGEESVLVVPSSYALKVEVHSEHEIYHKLCMYPEAAASVKILREDGLHGRATHCCW